MTPEVIHLSPPEVGEAEGRLVLAALRSNWVAPAGPDLDAFEQEVARWVGVDHAVALSSGTAALHLALQLSGVERGDVVLMPTFTFAATANAVLYLGAEPVLVDSSADTWAIDPALVADEIRYQQRHGRRVGAVLPMDVYGQCADYDTLDQICARFGVPLVVDAAESLGSTYRGRAAGSFGRAAALSFNGNKIITTGGGGMLVSSDAELARRARYLATQAREPLPHYEHREIGYNYRLSNLLAAVGLAQLQTLESRVARRRALRERYREAFAGEPGICLMPLADYGRSNCWLTCLLLDAQFGATAPEVVAHLRAAGIEARHTWKPMHQQPVHRGRRQVGGAVSDDLYRRGLCLPSGSALTDAQFERVTAAVATTPRQARRTA